MQIQLIENTDYRYGETYRFYGWESADEVKPIREGGFASLGEFYMGCLASWSVETCSVRFRGDWSEENPSVGQCTITAALVREAFGGEIFGLPLVSGGTHSFNRIGGRFYDLACEQFGKNALPDFDHAMPVDAETLLVGGDKAERCELLRQNLRAYASRPIVAIPLGDPAGVGPEIVVKAIANKEIAKIAKCLVVGDRRIVERAMRFPNMPTLKLRCVTSPESGKYHAGVLNMIDLGNLSPEDYTLGAVNSGCGQAAYEYIAKCIALAMEKKAAVVATPPINKEALHAAGVPYIGHTEIFGALTDTPDPLTIFEVRGMRIFFLTRHMSLRMACDAVKKDKIVSYVRRMRATLDAMGVTGGTIAVAGLNPHCGEHGLFGTEEVEEVIPAVTELQRLGYDVVGPIGADSVYHQALEGRFDAVLSLYHDQGHIAAKTVDFYHTISLTAGMPILRTSVDHGTAYDLAGKGLANSVSMEEAIRVAAKYAGKNRM